MTDDRIPESFRLAYGASADEDADPLPERPRLPRERYSSRRAAPRRGQDPQQEMAEARRALRAGWLALAVGYVLLLALLAGFAAVARETGRDALAERAGEKR